MKNRLIPLLLLLAAGTALEVAEAKQRPSVDAGFAPSVELAATQSGGPSLSQAVEQVRRRGDVERVLSAETRVRGNREVHHIKVMTKDGTVRTIQVNGRRR